MSITYRFRRDGTASNASDIELRIDVQKAMALFGAAMGSDWQYELKSEDATSVTYTIRPPPHFDPDGAAAILAKPCADFRLEIAVVR